MSDHQPRIALFLAAGFEEIEALTVVDLLRRMQLDITTVSIASSHDHTPLQVTGSHNITVTADTTIDRLSFEDMDMLVLPGGMPGTTHLEQCQPLIQQIRSFHEAGKYLAAICAAPGILGRMHLLEGQRAVCHPSVEPDLSGAIIPDEEVVVCGHFLTSRGMGTAIPFALAIVSELLDKEAAKTLSQNIVYEVYR